MPIASGNIRPKIGHAWGRFGSITSCTGAPTWRSLSAIRRVSSNRASVAEAVAAWKDQRIHTWVVSFKATNAFMRGMIHGDGVFYQTSNADELKPIFEEIAYSLPLLIVE